MDSPDDNLVAAASWPSSLEYPAVQDLPMLDYHRNLSPISSVKAPLYTHRFSETNMPTPPPVFTSPHIDLQQETTILERGNTVAAESISHGQSNTQLNVVQITCFDKEVQSCSPSDCIEEYLTDPSEVDFTNAVHSSSPPAKEVPRLYQGDGTSQSFLETFQITEACENPDDGQSALSKEFAKEANNYRRSTRRHLHFDAAAHKNVATGIMASSRANITNLNSLVLSPTEEGPISSSWEADTGPHYINLESSFSPFKWVRVTKNNVNSPISSSLSSGIWHLNRTGRSVLNSDMFANKNITGYLNSLDKLMPESSNVLAKDTDSIVISPRAGTMFPHADVDQQRIQAGLVYTSATSYPVNTLNPSSESPTNIKQQVAPCLGMMSASQNADNVGDFNQVSPKRRRKSITNTRENESCQLCRCKKSRCLKLYCECFSAGIFCMDSCHCEKCLNKPEYEDIVLDKKNKIKSSNPLAFTPKILPHATESPAIVEEGSWTTPSSARHKRGCNCKKSKCLKKYCECYQASVGCSDECRCDGCQNSFGTKAEYRRAERGNNLSHGELEIADSRRDASTEQFSPTPWEGHAVMRNLDPCLGVVLQAQLQCRSSVQSSTASLHPHCSSVSLKPGFPHVLTSDSALHDISGDYDLRGVLTDSTNTIRVEEGSSNHPRGLRCVGRFIWQDVRSFPTLSPYSNSKSRVDQVKK